MAFLLTNTRSAVPPSSLGGHKLCLFVFWALPPFTLPVHHWATLLCMSKLPKHLSVICKYWHKPSVNKFLNPAWQRVALGWNVQFAIFVIAGNQLQQPNFHSAHTPCLRETSDAVHGHCRSFFKSVSSFSCMQAYHPTHPLNVHSLHPVILVRSVWLQTRAKLGNDLSWFTNFSSWKRGLWGLTVNISASSSSWSEAGVQMQPTMRFLMLLKSTSFGLALILLCSGGNCKGWKWQYVLPTDANAAADNCKWNNRLIEISRGRRKQLQKHGAETWLRRKCLYILEYRGIFLALLFCTEKMKILQVHAWINKYSWAA